MGLNYTTDTFDDKRNLSANTPALDYRYATAGIFVQDEWKMAERLSLHSGLRGDVHNVFGTFVMPRMSALWKISSALVARLGAGTGYKIPTIFTSAAEARAFHDVLPVGRTLQAETSRGVNLDLNGKFVAGDMIINVNQAFYHTPLRHPLVPSPIFLQGGLLAYENAASPLISKGLDTNLHVALEESELYVDYSYTKVNANDRAAGGEAELTPKHKLNLVLIVEAEQSWRAGFEAFYIGRQYLGNQTWSRDFWLIGLMFQKTFGGVTIIGNVENAFDVRQSRYEKVVLPPYDRPTFRPLYAPLDGVVANAALEIKIR